MAKKKKANPLADAYALKDAHEQSLSAKEMADWDALVAKAEKAKKRAAFQAQGGKISLPQLPPENSIPLVSLPKQEQAAAIYELAQEGALPLSKVEQTKILKALALEEPTLFGGTFKPISGTAPAVDVPALLPSEDPRQLRLFDDPRSNTPVSPSVPLGAPAGKQRLSDKLKSLIQKTVGGGQGPRTARAASAPTAAAAEVTKKAGFLSKLPRSLKVAGGVGLALGAVDMLLGPAAEMGSGIGDQVMPGRVDRRLERMITGQEHVEQFQRMKEKRDRKLAELTQRNTLLLAQNAPHLFNQLMAGRTLPRGATVIGGEPRTDLVQEVAMGMSQGRFPPPQEGQLPLGGE